MLLPFHEAIFQYALYDKLVGAFGTAKHNVSKTCKFAEKSVAIVWIELRANSILILKNWDHGRKHEKLCVKKSNKFFLNILFSSDTGFNKLDLNFSDAMNCA